MEQEGQDGEAFAGPGDEAAGGDECQAGPEGGEPREARDLSGVGEMCVCTFVSWRAEGRIRGRQPGSRMADRVCV